MKRKILPLALVLFTATSYSQVGIGTLTPNKSAQLDIVSKNKGILIPRVALENTVDQSTINSGNVTSLLVYNTNTNSDIRPGYYYWYEDKWMRLVNDADVIALDKNTTNTNFTIVNDELVLTDSDGNFIKISVPELNILTTLEYNGVTNEITYIGENKIPIVLDLNEGTASYNEVTNIITYTNEAGVSTYLNLNNTNISYSETDKLLTYVNTLGQIQTINLASIVSANDGYTNLAFS